MNARRELRIERHDHTQRDARTTQYRIHTTTTIKREEEKNSLEVQKKKTIFLKVKWKKD